MARKFIHLALALSVCLIGGSLSSVFGQVITSDVVTADRLRSTDNGGNGQFWERVEDPQNTLRFLYGNLSGTPAKVDINNPLFQRLRITGRGSLISVGRNDLGADVALPTGAGGRMVWSIVKRAFRAGEVSGAQWDDVNVGQFSFAGGFNSVASGDRSVSLGDSNAASGFAATVFGNFNTAAGDSSFAVGTGSVAKNFATIAMGNFAGASGQVSAAIGNGATATGDFSLSLGETTTASGPFSLALGRLVTATGSNSFIIGSSDATSQVRMTNFIPQSLMIGFNSDRPTLFVSPSAGTGTSGNVGIGTIDTQKNKLFVNGNTFINGNLFVTGGVSQVSDMSLKTNIRSIDNALEKVLQLHGVTFEWKQGEAEAMPVGTQIGFTAQEMEKVLPEIVKTAGNGYKTISYENVTAVLVEAMKDQQKIIKQQQAEIDALKEQLQAISKRLADVK